MPDARHAEADAPPQTSRSRFRAPGRATLGRGAAAALAGLAVWASFPPLNWWPAAWVGVAVLTAVCRGDWGGDGRLRGVAFLGWLFGLGMFLPMLSFLRGLGLDAWLVLTVVMAGWFALLAVGIRLVARLPGWPLAVALLWVTEEWARDRVPFHGFPWGRLAFGQVHGPLLPLAAIGGAVLVTFVTALIGALLAAVGEGARHAASGTQRDRSGRRWAAGRPAMWLAIVVGVAIGGAAAVPLPTHGTTTGGASHAVVGVVQGNVPRLGLDEFAQRRAVTVNHSEQTRLLADDVAAGRVPRPDFVVWPENATDTDPSADVTTGQLIDTAVQAVGVPVLVGAVLDGPGPDHVSNAGVVWSPTTGPGEFYVKRHLVPFGEYLPWRSVLSKLIGRFSLIGKDFAPGHAPGVLTVGPARVADVICFEVADDDVVRDAVNGGGRLLVVQTNNATYERPGDDGQGGETAQQLEMSRLRAVEHGRAVVVAATSGVSAVIGPDGAVQQRSGVFRPARLVADVPLRDPRTVADRLGVWPEHALAALGLLLAIVGVVLRRRNRDRHGSVEESPNTQLVRTR